MRMGMFFANSVTGRNQIWQPFCGPQQKIQEL